MNYLWWCLLGYMIGWYACVFSIKRKEKKSQKMREMSEQASEDAIPNNKEFCE